MLHRHVLGQAQVSCKRNRRLRVEDCRAIMATYKLWSPPGNKNAFKALIAARYVGAKLDMPPMEMGKTNKTPEFLKLNPFGKVVCKLVLAIRIADWPCDPLLTLTLWCLDRSQPLKPHKVVYGKATPSPDMSLDWRTRVCSGRLPLIWLGCWHSGAYNLQSPHQFVSKCY